MDYLAEKIDRLERSLLELGTEVYSAKSELQCMRLENSKLVEAISGLRQLLDDKGILSIDDFDAAIAMSREMFEGVTSGDAALEAELERFKKYSN